MATEVPVLVAMDGVNLWENKTPFFDPDTFRPVFANQLAMVKEVSMFEQSAPVNGLSLFSVTNAQQQLSIPLHLKNAQLLLTVNALDNNEFEHCVQHFGVSRIISVPVTDKLKAQIRALTGANPRDMLEECMLL